jgi:uncharacterized protein YbjT (DUF2867 family)
VAGEDVEQVDDVVTGHVAPLTCPVGESGDYLLTGPESPTHEEVAQTMTEVFGRTIRYVDLPVPEMAAHLAKEGIPEPFATALPTMRPGVGESGRSEINTTVEDVTGRPPRTLATFLAGHADAFATS